jgi:hypothetical protein
MRSHLIQLHIVSLNCGTALEAVPQRTQHAPPLIQQSGIAAIAAGVAVWIVGNTRRIESYRICGVENLPGEFQLTLFGDPEDFGNAGVDAEVSITSVEMH